MMFSQIKWRMLGIPVLAIGLLLATDAPQAKSQGFGLQIGGFGGGFGVSSFGGRGFNRGFHPGFNRGFHPGFNRGFHPGFNNFNRGFNSRRSFRPNFHYGAPLYRSNFQAYRTIHPIGNQFNFQRSVIVPRGKHLGYFPGHYNRNYRRGF
ncbi:hypothetical protein LF1_44330 [Rubripirellula obstinata]|uniref:Uncharacterized protein n=2 Tax=Rubripirellula obstinata TaxID=406547 RepID=A0A5B1CND4_9BACT|nr:hypothetical protein [Rubripirellula obstinata]KAA1261872.1 hypothetical protein LF1_44330 [Rubripirellula obstinata]